MTQLPRIGRIFLAIPMVVFGAMHLMSADQMAGMAPFGGAAMIYLTGVLNIAVGVGLMSGFQLKNAAYGMAFLMFAYVVGVHIPGLAGAPDEASMQLSMSGLLKDLGLLGGALLAASTASPSKS